MLPSLRNALLVNAAGQPTDRHLVLKSRDWDEIASITDAVYMPYVVASNAKLRKPNSFQYTCDIGGFTLSRFRYGVSCSPA